MSKKFLYTDMDTVKSIAAQIYKGYLQDKQTSETNVDANSTTAGVSSLSKVNGGANSNLIEFLTGFGLKLDAELQFEDNDSNTTSNEDIVSESVNRSYGHYLINLIEEDLRNSNEIIKIQSSSEFDYVEYTTNYLYYDFATMKSSTDFKQIIPILFNDTNSVYLGYDELLKKYYAKNQSKSNNSKSNMKPEEKKEFEKDHFIATINAAAAHLDEILNNHFLLIDVDRNIVIIGSKENLSLPSVTISLSRKLRLKVFGMVTSMETPKENNDFLNLNDNGNKDAIESLKVFTLDLYLGTFFKFDKNKKYKIIHPISIEMVND